MCLRVHLRTAGAEGLCRGHSPRTFGEETMNKMDKRLRRVSLIVFLVFLVFALLELSFGPGGWLITNGSAQGTKKKAEATKGKAVAQTNGVSDGLMNSAGPVANK